MAKDRLPVFELEIYELHVVKRRIAAATPEEAIHRIICQGQGSDLDNSQEYIERADRYGSPLEEMDVEINVRKLKALVGDAVREDDDFGACVRGLRSITKEE